MSHYAPRRRQTDGRYDYTLRGKGGDGAEFTAPMGYCAGAWRDPAPAAVPREVWDREVERMRPFAAKFHEDGHPTPEAACACYRDYLIDLHTTLDAHTDDEQRRCEVCGEFTTGVAVVQLGFSQVFRLCDAHRTPDEVRKRLVVGESWEVG